MTVIRDSQDLDLVVEQPTTARIRDSEDLALVVSQPSTAKIRVSSDLSLAVIKRTWYGTASCTLRPLSVDVEASSIDNFTATSSVTLRRLSVVGSGSFGAPASYTGTAAVTLKHVTASATGLLSFSGTLAATLKLITVSGTASAGGVGNVTLPRLVVSGTAQLGSTGAAAISLKHLTAAATGTAFFRVGSIATTLPRLTISASGTILAQAYLTHNLFWKYKTDDLKVAWIKTYHGSRQVQVSRRVPAGTNQAFAAVFTEATTIALSLYSSQDVTLTVNAQTINLLARQALIWTEDSLEDYPFDADVSTILVSNAGVNSATFIISVLVLDASL
jgi:hypothetical protein